MIFGYNFWMGVLLTQDQRIWTAFCMIFSRMIPHSCHIWLAQIREPNTAFSVLGPFLNKWWSVVSVITLRCCNGFRLRWIRLANEFLWRHRGVACGRMMAHLRCWQFSPGSWVAGYQALLHHLQNRLFLFPRRFSTRLVRTPNWSWCYWNIKS